jgi:hypothetical protein
MAERAFRYNASVRTDSPRLGGVVTGGPFAGMRYPDDVARQVDAFALKSSGRYEAELHETIDRALDWRPRQFVDIGSSDGYYAVGFARLGLPVTAYEASESARQVCLRLADANDVQIALLGACRRIPKLDHSLVLIDVEGNEDRLLSRQAAGVLRSSTVIVETHERARPGIIHRLQARFVDTHMIERLRGGFGSGDGRLEPPTWLAFWPR